MKKIVSIIAMCISLATPGVAQKTAFSDSVYNYICEKNILHPDIVMRQAILETGWFKSPFLMTRNNLFGFRSQEYLYFKSWKASVDYYKEWQMKRYKNQKEDYYKFLIRIKYAAKGYIGNLKNIKYAKKCP